MKRALYVVRRSRIELDFPGCYQPAAYVPHRDTCTCYQGEVWRVLFGAACKVRPYGLR